MVVPAEVVVITTGVVVLVVDTPVVVRLEEVCTISANAQARSCTKLTVVTIRVVVVEEDVRMDEELEVVVRGVVVAAVVVTEGPPGRHWEYHWLLKAQ